jgi:hypothetical protein
MTGATSGNTRNSITLVAVRSGLQGERGMNKRMVAMVTAGVLLASSLMMNTASAAPAPARGARRRSLA